MFENLEAIITLLTLIIGLIGMLITFISKYSKSEKLKKFAEKYIQITRQIQIFMEKAELNKELSGADKKQWVKLMIKDQIAKIDGFELDDDAIDFIIENAIKFSKNVNYNKKE